MAASGFVRYQSTFCCVEHHHRNGDRGGPFFPVITSPEKLMERGIFILRPRGDGFKAGCVTSICLLGKYLRMYEKIAAQDSEKFFHCTERKNISGNHIVAKLPKPCNKGNLSA